MSYEPDAPLRGGASMPLEAEQIVDPAQVALLMARHAIATEQRLGAGQTQAERLGPDQYVIAGNVIDLSSLQGYHPDTVSGYQKALRFLLDRPFGEGFTSRELASRVRGLSGVSARSLVSNLLTPGEPVSRLMGRYVYSKGTGKESLTWLDLPADLNRPEAFPSRFADEGYKYDALSAKSRSVVSEHPGLAGAEQDLIAMMVTNDTGVLPPKERYSKAQLKRVLRALAGKRELGSDAAITNYYMVHDWLSGNTGYNSMLALNGALAPEIADVYELVQARREPFRHKDANCARSGFSDLFVLGEGETHNLNGSSLSDETAALLALCFACKAREPCLVYGTRTRGKQEVDDRSIFGALDYSQRRFPADPEERESLIRKRHAKNFKKLEKYFQEAKKAERPTPRAVQELFESPPDDLPGG